MAPIRGAEASRESGWPLVLPATSHAYGKQTINCLLALSHCICALLSKQQARFEITLRSAYRPSVVIPVPSLSCLGATAVKSSAQRDATSCCLLERTRAVSTECSDLKWHVLETDVVLWLEVGCAPLRLLYVKRPFQPPNCSQTNPMKVCTGGGNACNESWKV